MYTINEDLSIYATRGDIVAFSVTAEDNGENYKFQPGDVVRIKVYGKKDAENVVLQKDFPVLEETEQVEIFLSEQDTKIGEVISKPKDYWYEVELNPNDNPQTIIGYDEDGAKVFKLFPEGDDIPEHAPDPRVLPKAIDEELDLTSPRPVENRAIAKAIIQIDRNCAATHENMNKHAASKDNPHGVTAAQAKARPDTWTPNLAEVGGSNPNLLDNWYFADPINQRGQTEYNNLGSGGYTVDRWYLANGSGVNYVKIIDGGIRVRSGENGFLQHFEPEIANELNGKTCTLSFKLVSGELYSATRVFPSGRIEFPNLGGDQVEVTFGLDGNKGIVSFLAFSGYLDIEAVKLELGSVQTLAHKDANGNWVLNDPPPDKGVELLKCCMSTADSSDTYANNKVTPAAVNALPLDGSQKMTGSLKIKGLGEIDCLETLTYLKAIKDINNFRYLRVINPSLADYTLAKCIQFGNVVNGSEKNYNLHGEHNKPGGSYNGNGNATARTVETGGIGYCILVWRDSYFSIVTALGAIVCKTSDKTVRVLDANSIKFISGTLTIATTDDGVNGSGKTYSYQVL